MKGDVDVGQDRIRVGIGGLGRSGWGIHSRILGELPEYYDVVAVTDDDSGRCAEARERFGCRTYSSYEAMLEDDEIEMIVVALPSFLHADASIAALKAGKCVVCEKPMATNLADADRMIAAAEQTGQILTVFQNRRYDPDYLTVREVIESGRIGRVVQINMTGSGFSRRWDWQTLQKFGGGSLNNTAVHYLDQAVQLFGEAQPRVMCHMERALTLGDAEDHVKVILHGEGPLIDVEVTSACAYPTPTWRVFATLGGLVGTTKELQWKWVDPAALPERTVDTRPTPDRSYNREDYEWHEASWTVDDYDGPGQNGYYIDLFRTVREGAPLAVTPASVRRVMWVIEECHCQSPV